MTNLAGGVLHASEQAQHLLMMAFLPFRSPAADWRGLGQPRPEIVALCRSLTATAKGKIGQQPPALRLRNPWGEFVLRAYWFGPTDGVEQTHQIGITIERRVPRALTLRRRVEELPLTGREKQLCLLMAHERSRQDVADAMGVSTGTVITQQSSIYAKLGVRSRAELLATLAPG
jgi:DNA-binding CsgD family transcriptional regulator